MVRDDDSLRECRHALWHRARGAARHQRQDRCRLVPFPHRAERCRQIEPVEADLYVGAALARPGFAVRSGRLILATRRVAALAATHRRDLSGFPPDRASLHIRQCRVAVARRRRERKQDQGQRHGVADLGRARGADSGAAADPVGRPAATRRHRARGDRAAEPDPRRRADRQCRRRNGGAAVAPAGGDEPAGYHRDRGDAQPLSRDAHGPAAPASRWRADRADQARQAAPPEA